MSEKLRLPTEINSHHLWYQRSQYRKCHEKRFRNTPGFVVPTTVPVHNQLHAELFYGPPKPKKNEMADLVDYVEGDVHPSLKVDRFWGAEAAMKFFIIQEFDNEEYTERYQATRTHLARQIGILSRKSTGVEFPTPEELYRYGKVA